jgi:16S rRNA (adenine1518-N6/adenine1519-N6)-dimethyltransferase
MTPTEIKKVIASLGGGTNKRLGQHFLIDASALDAVVREAHLHPGMITLEVGPGLGVLTQGLLDAGHDVIAVERDPRFISYLESRFQKNSKLKVIRGDAAQLDWMEIVKDSEWQLVSNLPYAISSLALRLALWSPHPAENIVVMLQREVAERAAGKNGKTSLLSLMVALASSDIRIVKRVAPGAFYPPPKVESAILQIEPMPVPERVIRWGIDPEKIMKVAKKGFAHPRKLLASNLELSSTGSRLSSFDIPDKARAEDLSPDDWAKLTIGLQV